MRPTPRSQRRRKQAEPPDERLLSARTRHRRRVGSRSTTPLRPSAGGMLDTVGERRRIRRPGLRPRPRDAGRSPGQLRLADDARRQARRPPAVAGVTRCGLAQEPHGALALVGVDGCGADRPATGAAEPRARSRQGEEADAEEREQRSPRPPARSGRSGRARASGRRNDGSGRLDRRGGDARPHRDPDGRRHGNSRRPPRRAPAAGRRLPRSPRGTRRRGTRSSPSQ